MKKRQTRKQRQSGGAWFGKPSRSVNNARKAVYEVQQRAAQNEGHSKSKVANILGGPVFKYTNKERIQNEAASRIRHIEDELNVSHNEVLAAIEEAKSSSPSELVSSMRAMQSRMETSLKNAAPTAAAVTLTIPIGLAQIWLKAVRVFVALMVAVMSATPSMMWGVNVSKPIKAILPNTNFSTTRSVFDYLKGIFSEKI